MESSKALFYEESYLQKSSSTVVALKKVGELDAIILDSTIFYPEGGGQPGDRGFIDNLKVLDTQRIDNEICHLVENKGNLSVGSVVTIKIDWSHRYDYMQQHSAQHLLSGMFYTLFKIGTVSVHLGSDDFSIELDSLDIDDKTILKVEEEANKAVCSSELVSDSIYPDSEIPKLNLRRPIKVEGDVRIVKMGDYDRIACGGIHVKNLNEIRYIQFLRTERIRGHLRTFWVAGDRSVSLIRKNREIVDISGTLLSRGGEQVVDGIKELQRQIVDCNYHYAVQSVKVAQLLFEKEAVEIENHSVAVFDATGWSDPEFKALAEVLLNLNNVALAVVREQNGEKLQWMVALKQDKEDSSFFKRVKEEALPLIEGKGGGRTPLWQGVGTKIGGKKEFLEQLLTIFTQILSSRTF
ncbi:MAG: alanyl-tRNA editing protein [Candidatus Cloacimonetes bacterium]|jgi:alanyl-tRNA synthetase|nr:alanyl-tRNA editing protein [Candidatus Cloacimonadota bacterium]